MVQYIGRGGGILGHQGAVYREGGGILGHHGAVYGGGGKKVIQKVLKKIRNREKGK